LEKHFLNAATMLNESKQELRNKLNDWCTEFLKANHNERESNIKLQLNELFIGLHDDTTSSIVLQLARKSTNNADELLAEAKKILIQCATPDSIIRYYSNPRINETEKNILWNCYFEEQKHLSLKDLIEYHLIDKKINKTNLVQLTTYSKSELSSLDKERFDVFEICLLKSFDTQLQFEKKIEQFLATTTIDEPIRILLIQTDLNQIQNADLIACARHTIVEKLKEASSSLNKYIFLLINLPRENAKSFIGFQLGVWSCYHLDEIESESNIIPEFKCFKDKSLSNLIKQNETNMEPKLLLKHLAHNACSLIKDTNLERTIYRIDLFTKLCGQSEQFVNVILNRLVSLLKMKESEIGAGLASKWLFREAANLRTIKYYSTLRRACLNYFESKLSPLLAYLLAFLDKYSNLDIYANALNETGLEWKSTLWIDLLKNTEICPLNYSDMRIDNKEMREFECQSDWLIKSFQETTDENKCLKPMLPFFWILVGQLNKLYDNFIESNKKNQETVNIFNSLI